MCASALANTWATVIIMGFLSLLHSPQPHVGVGQLPLFLFPPGVVRSFMHVLTSPQLRTGEGPSVGQGLSSLELYPAIVSHFVLPRHAAVSSTQGVHWLPLGSRCLLSGLECSQGSELGPWQGSPIFLLSLGKCCLSLPVIHRLENCGFIYFICSFFGCFKWKR